MNQGISVHFFGITREIVGSSTLAVDLPASGRVDELLEQLKKRYPALSSLRSILIAVNAEYADSERVIHPNDEVALIPPVSGG